MLFRCFVMSSILLAFKFAVFASIHCKMSVRHLFKVDTDVCVSVGDYYTKTWMSSGYNWWFILRL